MNNCGEKNITSYFTLEDDLLGSNSEIGLRLRQFYMKIQEEAIPTHLLELLDKLSRVEQTSLNSAEKA
ncbi:NepR family anti-sigma factor [Bartonella sp. A05]|uniref:NepR family anti-sigma factor n=1 Tax=Bartonella sp. A05 TaxID=2967261 RepID=UPI0022A95786|nr:NepR family anti-sigma factor [Bartonella sp. A05]MCZ2203734.1 NepR family anti-sigma factor [Bartonella sp. A05]